MNPLKNNKTTILFFAVLALLVVFIVTHSNSNAPIAKPVTGTVPTHNQTPATTPIKSVTVAPVVQGAQYHTLTIVSDPTKQLTAAVGPDNVQTVLEINRIDAANIKKGAVLIIPNDFSNTVALSPFPQTLDSAAAIPKLMVVSLQMQAFAIYNFGALVRWGGVNTGKQSTQTPARLYFANWKGKSVTSSEDDSWILPWYVNLDNTRGISMHQYALPGYPASHACVRMFEQDAEWIYNWVDQWTVSDDGQTVLTHGTPVIVFGQYDYGKTSPWKNLVKDPSATTITSETLNTVVSADSQAITAAAVNTATQ